VQGDTHEVVEIERRRSAETAQPAMAVLVAGFAAGMGVFFRGCRAAGVGDSAEIDFLLREIKHIYKARPSRDHRGVDLISDVLPFGRLWYGEPDAVSNAIGYAKFFGGSHHALIRVYNAAGNMVKTHEHAGDFKEP
jgi:hypothetical protein